MRHLLSVALILVVALTMVAAGLLPLDMPESVGDMIHYSGPGGRYGQPIESPDRVVPARTEAEVQPSFMPGASVKAGEVSSFVSGQGWLRVQDATVAGATLRERLAGTREDWFALKPWTSQPTCGRAGAGGKCGLALKTPPPAATADEGFGPLPAAPTKGGGFELGSHNRDSGGDYWGGLADVLDRVEGRPKPQRTQQGEITYYHPSLAWDGVCCLMADGVTPYDPRASGIVAAVSWPLGSLLYVCGPSRRCLQVEVRDRGLGGDDWIDMSEADFTVLVGSLGPGRAKVSIREMSGP